MEDKLERFVRDHSDEFDEHELPVHVWGRVQTGMQRPVVARPLTAWPALAASVLLIAGSFIWFCRQSVTVAIPHTVVTAPAPVAPDMAEAEAYYNNMIDRQQQQLEQHCTQYPDLCHDLDQEIKRLDEYYASLKKEYNASGNKELIKRSMIENLQMRVELAASQLKIIQGLNGNRKNNIG